MQDLSFIRLEPNFNDAKFTRPGSAVELFTYGQVCLSPDESYMQTTNTLNGIAFDGNYQVTVIDCQGNQLQDITANTFINERTVQGIPQIDFEIINTGIDFYAKPVFLKFKHTVSNYEWFSNPINITDYFFHKSSRFVYKKATDERFKSIRLQTYFTVNDAEDVSSEYRTYEGRRVSNRLIKTELEKYVFSRIDNFTYRRLNDLLGHDVVYINGYRVTNKQTLPSKDYEGLSNFFSIDFKVPIDYTEVVNDVYQINVPLTLTSKTPFGVYASADAISSISGTFNKNISIGSGTLRLYKNGILVGTFATPDIVISGNAFTITLGLTLFIDSYYIEMDQGLFISDIGELSESITEPDGWAFSIVEGYYSDTYYNSTYYLT